MSSIVRRGGPVPDLARRIIATTHAHLEDHTVAPDRLHHVRLDTFLADVTVDPDGGIRQGCIRRLALHTHDDRCGSIPMAIPAASTLMATIHPLVTQLQGHDPLRLRNLQILATGEVRGVLPDNSTPHPTVTVFYLPARTPA